MHAKAVQCVQQLGSTRAKPALVNAVHAFYHGEDVGIGHPDHNITWQHSSTVGARYPSIHAFCASMDACNTRGKGGKNGSASSGELKPYNFTWR